MRRNADAVCTLEASNAGGVAVSGLEMAQNSQRLGWTPAEVDAKLKGIMTNCYEVSPAPFCCLFVLHVL
jgi:glutamate dehydrogenase/leucine dehydrogenase